MNIDFEQNTNIEKIHPLFYFQLYLEKKFYDYVSKQSKKYHEKICETDNIQHDIRKSYLLEPNYIRKYILTILSMGMVDLPSY